MEKVNEIDLYFKRMERGYNIYSQELLEELKHFGEDKALENKVRRIHWRCIRQGHIAWADAMQLKYSQYFPKSDLVMAFGYSLMAHKNLLK